MARARTPSRASAAALLAEALALPDVVGGIACAGTALESRTATLRGKAFLFIGPKEARLKLGPSLARAQKLARSNPAVRPSASGWVAVSHEAAGTLTMTVLRSWVRESHGLFAGKKQPMEAKPTRSLEDGSKCRVVGGVHKGKSGTVRDIKTGATGHVSITVVQASGARFKTLARHVAVEG